MANLRRKIGAMTLSACAAQWGKPKSAWSGIAWLKLSADRLVSHDLVAVMSLAMDGLVRPWFGSIFATNTD